MKEPESNIQDRIEKRMNRLRQNLNDSDQLWINRWAQGTAALRYPEDGDNRPVEVNPNQE